MKLRNKKTGDIKSIEEIIRDAFLSNELDLLKSIDTNWEEIEPKEPLIKDEKVKKLLGEVVELELAVNELNKRFVEFNKHYTELCGKEE